MTNSAGAVQNGLVLRVSVPTSGEMATLGSELACRLAEQLGVKAPHASRVAAAIGELSRQVDSSTAAAVEFEFHKHDAQLEVLARCDGRTADTRIALNA
jgi:hypothetical protein